MRQGLARRSAIASAALTTVFIMLWSLRFLLGARTDPVGHWNMGRANASAAPSQAQALSARRRRAQMTLIAAQTAASAAQVIA